MFRYLALVWQPDIVHQEQDANRLAVELLASSSSWNIVMRARGLQVLCAGAPSGSLRIHSMHDDCGVVLGALFHRSTSLAGVTTQVDALDEHTTTLILESRGEHLIGHYWGNYVAFFCEPRSGTRWVLNDPCGLLPCLITRSGGVTIVFSCIADCVRLGLKFSPSLVYVREHALSGGRNQTASSLEGISRVYGGERLEFRADAPATSHARALLWNPMRFAAHADELEQPEQAARMVRNTVRACTHAWVSSHGSVVHRLSGGLDSSIVLGCLRDAPSKPEITACTYFEPDARSDERPWARQVAQFVGCKHVEIALNPQRVRLKSLPPLQPTIQPTNALHLLWRVDFERSLIKRCSATAVFTGLGGDSGFCGDSKAFAVVDYLQRHGPRLSAVRVAGHVAHALQLTQWYVLLRSLMIWLAGPRMRDQRQAITEASQLVSREVRESIAELERFPHPWFHDCPDVPWAVIRRLGELPYHPEFYDPSLDPDASVEEIVSPLYSQPAIELFLRIPLYTHFLGGRDRGLARRAFRGDVPHAILDREWKDRAPGYAERLVEANVHYLREMLLDGLLVRERILDRDALEQALSPSAFRSTAYPGEILRHLDTELWLRAWHAGSR